MPWLVEPGILGKRLVYRTLNFVTTHAAKMRRLGGGFYSTDQDIPATPKGDVVPPPPGPTPPPAPPPPPCPPEDDPVEVKTEPCTYETAVIEPKKRGRPKKEG
jgi:hypothetical protein